jgi:surface protein
MARANTSISKKLAKAFISTWNTANTSTGSSSNVRVKLPLVSIGTYNFNVNWGDGSSNTITAWNQAEVTHTYSVAGTYTITITGFIKGWDFSNYAGVVGGDRLKITSITQWGCLRLVDNNAALVAGAFYGCENLNLSGVTDIFNFKGVTNSNGMLRTCRLNSTIPNLDKWDVSKIKVFRSMLREMPTFDQNVGNWNVSSGEDFVALFNGHATIAPYGSFNNGNSDSIKNWNMSNATSIAQIFYAQPKFNQPIGSWDTSKNTSLSFSLTCLAAAPGIFNQDLSNWDTSNVTTLASLFQNQPVFNKPIGNWNISKVTSLSSLFLTGGSGEFNQDLSNWDTSSVTNMNSVFSNQKVFDQPIGSWNTSKVTNMYFMFGTYGAPQGIFNQDISNWDTSKVTNMSSMLQNQSMFDQEIGKWNIGNVTNMEFFLTTNNPSPFNNGGSASINNWDLRKVTNLNGAFERSVNFNQPINNWQIPLVTTLDRFLYEIPSESYSFSIENYSNFLINLASQPLKPNVTMKIWQQYNSSAVSARAILTSAPNNWTILDKGLQS